MTALFAIVAKETRLLLRDPGGLLMLFVLPAVFIVTLSVALQGAFTSGQDADKLAVLVLNEDEGGLGGTLIEQLGEVGLFRVLTEIEGARPTRGEAVAGLGENGYRIFIHVPPAATQASLFLDKGILEILVDPVVSPEVAAAIRNTVQSLVYVAMIDAFGPQIPNVPDLNVKDGIDFQGAQRGLKVEQRYVTTAGDPVKPNAVQQNVPGWTIFALFWIAMVLSLNLVNERLSGANTRIRVAPVSTAAYLAGKVVPFFAINMVQAGVMFGIGVFVLPLLGCPPLRILSPGGLILLTAAISLCAIAFGLLLSTISTSTMLVASVNASVLIIMTIVGGIMVPKYIMPAVMQSLSLFVPQGWALDGYLNVLVRGYDTQRILPQAGVVLVFAAVFFAAALWRIRRLRRTG